MPVLPPASSPARPAGAAILPRVLASALLALCGAGALSGCAGKDYNNPPPASAGVTPGAGHPVVPPSGHDLPPPSRK